MNTAKFNTVLAALEHLTDQQIRRVERVLKGESPEKQVIHAIQQRAMFAKSVELFIITVLVNCAGIKCYEIYRI